MKTKLATGPLYFHSTVNGNNLEVYCVRLEIYNLKTDTDDAKIQFLKLLESAKENPEIAHALIKLGDLIQQHKQILTNKS